MNSKIDSRVAVLTDSQKRRLAVYLSSLKVSRSAKIKPQKSQTNSYRLSLEQIWFAMLSLQSDESNFAQTPIVVSLDGPLDRALLEQSIHAVMARQDSLRVTLDISDDGLFANISPESNFSLELLDLTENGKSCTENAVNEALVGLLTRPLHLNGPVFRAGLVKLSEKHHLFALTLHHAVSDTRSLDVLFSELVEHYSAAYEGRSPDVPELPVRYSDYIAWRRDSLQSGGFEEALLHWVRKVATFSNPIRFTSETVAPDDLVTYRAIRAYASDDIKEAIREAAHQLRVSPFVITFSAYALLLSYWRPNGDLVIGVGTAGRQVAETRNLIGLFAGSLPICLLRHLTGTVSEFIDHVADAATEAFEYQQVSVDMVRWAFKSAGRAAPERLFHVHFDHQAPMSSTAQAGRLAIRPFEIEQQSEDRYTMLRSADLLLNVKTTADGMRFTLTCDEACIEPALGRMFLSRYLAILRKISTAPDSDLDTIRNIAGC